MGKKCVPKVKHSVSYSAFAFLCCSVCLLGTSQHPNWKKKRATMNKKAWICSQHNMHINIYFFSLRGLFLCTFSFLLWIADYNIYLCLYNIKISPPAAPSPDADDISANSSNSSLERMNSTQSSSIVCVPSIFSWICWIKSGLYCCCCCCCCWALVSDEDRLGGKIMLLDAEAEAEEVALALMLLLLLGAAPPPFLRYTG